jgi:hypothetical protein
MQQFRKRQDNRFTHFLDGGCRHRFPQRISLAVESQMCVSTPYHHAYSRSIREKRPHRLGRKLNLTLQKSPLIDQKRQ